MCRGLSRSWSCGKRNLALLVEAFMRLVYTIYVDSAVQPRFVRGVVILTLSSLGCLGVLEAHFQCNSS